MRSINSLPERFLRNLSNEFNKNVQLQKQLNLFKSPKTYKSFGELNLPPFYGFNTFNLETTEYELPLFLIKGLDKLGLTDLQRNVKRDLIKELSETFDKPKFLEVLEYKSRKPSFKCLINGNIYNSEDLQNDIDM